MKQLTAPAPERQEVWRHKGREYSIVDIRKPIVDFGHLGTELEELLVGLADGYPFEVSELEEWPSPNAQDIYNSVRVLRRFRTIEDARDSIESGMIHE